MKIDIQKIPEFVKHVSQTLFNAGYQSFIVGGSVRDLALGKEPKDWDITTSATPDQIIELFEKTVYENVFGTVLVVDQSVTETENYSENSVSSVEVTPFRQEGKYTDRRHPDNVVFSTKIEDDLMRRDFTINALAYNIHTGEFVDLFHGLSDLENKIIKTVGSPDERFNEDPLRIVRAVRFVAQLGFTLDSDTMMSVTKNKDLVKHISSERIRDEFVKIINTDMPAQGIDMLRRFGILELCIPELLEGVGCHQGGAHKYDVYEHLLHALAHAADKKFDTRIRLAALFHDIGKPRTKREPVKSSKASYFLGPRVSSPDTKKVSTFSDFKSGTKPTFYGHEVVGAKMAKKIMERLKFGKSETDYIVKLVRYHMFFSDTDVITLTPVRRMIVNMTAGIDANGFTHESHPVWDLMKIRECDRVGMAKSEAPERLRKYHAMIDEALRDPISVKQLKIDGNYLMQNMGVKPGPRMGNILNILLEDVINDPAKNEIHILEERVKQLELLNDADLKNLAEKAKDKKEEVEEAELSKIYQDHGVKHKSK